MQDLYNAVMIVGRSLTLIDLTGWTCGSLGEQVGPKCVNGIVSMAAGTRHPQYIDDTPHEMWGPVRLVAITLIETCPEEIRTSVLARWGKQLTEHEPGDDSYEALQRLIALMQRPQDTEESLGELGNLLAVLNDCYGKNMCVILDRERARAWFERAFDKLAAQLPDPLPRAKTYTEIVEEAVAAIDRNRVPVPA